MKRLACALVLLLTPALASAAERTYWLVFKDGGGRIGTVGEWQIRDQLVIVHDLRGQLYSVRLKDIDFEVTRDVNNLPKARPVLTDTKVQVETPISDVAAASNRNGGVAPGAKITDESLPRGDWSAENAQAQTLNAEDQQRRDEQAREQAAEQAKQRAALQGVQAGLVKLMGQLGCSKFDHASLAYETCMLRAELSSKQ